MAEKKTGSSGERHGEGNKRPLMRLLGGRIQDRWLDWLVWSLYHGALRRPLLGILERNLLARSGSLFGRFSDERKRMARAVLQTIDRLAQRRAVSPAVLRRSLGQWVRVLWSRQSPDSPAARFEKIHGQGPPWFLTIGSGQACNLRCPGCYASSGPSQALLPYPVLERILQEAQTLWGVPLFVFSSGERTARRWNEHGSLDLMESFPDSLTLVFTNGTLIDEEIARRMAQDWYDHPSSLSGGLPRAH